MMSEILSVTHRYIHNYHLPNHKESIMKTVSIFFMLMIVIGVFTLTIDAQTISMQGVLRDPGGRSVEDAQYSITFKIYDALTGGSQLWTETQANVQTSYGVFSVQLGAVTPLSSLSFDRVYYVGIIVAGGTELVPRSEIIISPYSRAVLGASNEFPSSGNVGVGTLNPAVKLDVIGNFKASGTATFGGKATITSGGADVTGNVNITTGDVVLSAGGTGKVVFPDGSSFTTALMGGSASSVSNTEDASITADGDGNGSGSVIFKTLGTNERMRIANNGNIGIGTTSPSGTLDVNGSLYATWFVDRENTSYYIDPNNNSVVNGLGVTSLAATTVNAITTLNAPRLTDRDNGTYYVDPASRSNVLEMQASRYYDDDASYYVDANTISMMSTVNASTSIIAPKFYDRDNQGYYVDPASMSNMSSLKLDGNTSYTLTFNYLNATQNTIGYAANTNSPASLYCSWRVSAPEFDAYSDKRIKNILGISNTRKDLTTLKKIEVTDYTLVDKIAQGDKEYKKVIGQQVTEVYPQAVRKTTDFIPNVYEVSSSVSFNAEKKELSITTNKEHEFAIGNKVRLIISTDEKETKKEFEVIAVSDNHTFSVNYDNALDKVFVYGKQVNDFLVVDYEAIAMLNVSATQELAKQVEELQKENTGLKLQLTKIETLEQELRALKTMLKTTGGDNSLGMLTKPAMNDKK